MNILNQSIASHGKPAFPPEGNISTNAAQHLSMAPFHHQPHSLQVLQLKKDRLGATTSAVAKGEESFSKTTEADFENQKQNCMLDFISNSVCKVPDLFKRESNLLKQPIAHFEDIFSDKQNAVLAVAVSSAVKLERKQMDKIAKEVKKMTGLSNIRQENNLDPSLITRSVIACEKEGSHVLDLSIKGQLAELTARIESKDLRNVILGKIKTPFTGKS